MMRQSLVAALAVLVACGWGTQIEASRGQTQPQSAPSSSPVEDRTQRTREIFKAGFDEQLRTGAPTTFDPVPALYLPAQFQDADIARVAALWPETKIACEVAATHLHELSEVNLSLRRTLIPPFWEMVRKSISEPKGDARTASKSARHMRQAWRELASRLDREECAALQTALAGSVPETESDSFIEHLATVRRASARRIAYSMTPGASMDPIAFLDRWMDERKLEAAERDIICAAIAPHVATIANLYDQWDLQKTRVILAESEMLVALESSKSEDAPTAAAEQRRLAYQSRGPALRGLASVERAVVGETRAIVDAAAETREETEAQALRRAFEIETFGVLAIDPYDIAELLRLPPVHDEPEATRAMDTEGAPDWREQAAASAATTTARALRAYREYWNRYVERYTTNAEEEAKLYAEIEGAYRDSRARSSSVLLTLFASMSDNSRPSEWLDARLAHGDQRAAATLSAVRERLPPVRQMRTPDAR